MLGTCSVLEHLEKVSIEHFDFAEHNREHRAPNFARAPSTLIIGHLYRIGLSLISKNHEKTSRFYNPLLILIVNTICLIKCIVSIILSEENEKLLIINGDFAHFFQSKTHLNVAAFLVFLLTLIQQLIYYSNTKNNINPTYYKVYDMCLIRPDKRIVHSIALSNTRSKLKRSISLMKNNN